MRKLIINIVLAFIAFDLALIFIPLGILFGFIKSIFIKKNPISVLENSFFSIAKGIDQTGNSTCALLWNTILIKDDSMYPFGNIDETISSVLGKNKQIGNLTWLGEQLDRILDICEKNHTIKSIGE